MTKIKLKSGLGGENGFTLPEVIISFSVLIMVITSATGILVSVLRSNADNVHSLVAYGLAQEGIEAARMIRDTDALLGLEFDGSKSGKTPWDAKLFDGDSASEFVLIKKSDLSACQATLKADQISNCLPYQILKVSSGNSDPSAVVYKKNNSEGGDPASPAEVFGGETIFKQVVSGTPSGFQDSGYKRYLRIEPIHSVSGGTGMADVMRVSSVVTWLSNNGNERKLVLTTDLTNWK